MIIIKTLNERINEKIELLQDAIKNCFEFSESLFVGMLFVVVVVFTVTFIKLLSVYSLLFVILYLSFVILLFYFIGLFIRVLAYIIKNRKHYTK